MKKKQTRRQFLIWEISLYGYTMAELTILSDSELELKLEFLDSVPSEDFVLPADVMSYLKAVNND